MMDKQMSFFNEGGLTDPNTEVDPVSGNEVPPGSLPEEVRDDVDAQLSEGEYVVPADVLRYYGMKFFEDLRSTAQQDLARMDSEGRIGGKPAPDTGDISPEDMAMLKEAMSEPQMNKGGMVVGLGNPEFQPGYSQGGMIDNPLPNPTFNPDQWSVGSSYGGGSTNTGGVDVGSYYKAYKGPNGETIMVLFSNGQPQRPIPEGFVEVKNAATEQQKKAAQEATELPDFGGLADQGVDYESAQSSWAEENADAIKSDPVGYAQEQLGSIGQGNLAGKAVGGLLGFALGGPAGGLKGFQSGGKYADVDNVANTIAAIEEAERQGIDVADLKGQAEEAQKGLGTFGGFLAGVMGKGNSRAVENYTGQKTTTQEAIPTSTSKQGDSTPEVDNTNTPSRSGNAPEADLTGTGGMNKGGLVKKRKRKTTK